MKRPFLVESFKRLFHIFQIEFQKLDRPWVFVRILADMQWKIIGVVQV